MKVLGVLYSFTINALLLEETAPEVSDMKSGNAE
jgi:hypothetical protein